MGGMAEARNTRNVSILASVARICAHGVAFALPPLAVATAQQTHVPVAQVLGWMVLGYLAYGLGPLPAAVVADHIAPRLLLVVAVFGSGVGALAASESPNAQGLTLSLAIMGLGAAISGTAAGALLDRIPQAGRARRVSTWAARISVASIPVVTAALATRVGWQPTLRGFGYNLCAAAVGISFLPLRPEPTAAAMTRRHAAVQRSAAEPLAMVVVILSSIAGGGGLAILPACLAERFPALGFGAATSAALAVALIGRVAAARLIGGAEARRFWVLLRATALVALLVMAVATGALLFASATVFAACAVTLQWTDARTATRLLAHRRRAGALATATIGTCAAAGIGIVAAAPGAALNGAFLALAAVDLLAVIAAVRQRSVRPPAAQWVRAARSELMNNPG